MSIFGNDAVVRIISPVSQNVVAVVDDQTVHSKGLLGLSGAKRFGKRGNLKAIPSPPNRDPQPRNAHHFWKIKPHPESINQPNNPVFKNVYSFHTLRDTTDNEVLRYTPSLPSVNVCTWKFESKSPLQYWRLEKDISANGNGQFTIRPFQNEISKGKNLCFREVQGKAEGWAGMGLSSVKDQINYTVDHTLNQGFEQLQKFYIDLRYGVDYSEDDS